MGANVWSWTIWATLTRCFPTPGIFDILLLSYLEKSLITPVATPRVWVGLAGVGLRRKKHVCKNLEPEALMGP
jgi:hypothetical protein